jgi:hypothetical protein
MGPDIWGIVDGNRKIAKLPVCVHRRHWTCVELARYRASR